MTYGRPALFSKAAWRASLLATTCLCIGVFPDAGRAAPVGGSVAYGQADIATVGPVTTINQSSQRTVIDWHSFNIDAHEETRFVQPGASAVAVNRIHDVNPSTILGKLTANGQVILVNQNGVVFGSGAQIDVNSLVVSTAMPTEQVAHDFALGLRHDLPLSVTGRPDASIINHGLIRAKDAGLVGFVAPNIINDGVIIANGGSVQLASGSTATLDLYGDGLIDIAVDPTVHSQLIAQGGLIQANGGKVVLTAAAGQTIVNSLINMDGVIEANSVGQKDGKIILSASGVSGTSKSGKSQVKINGSLKAGSLDAKGGSVTVTADDITLGNQARIDVSGHTGGGHVFLGGDYQGKGLLPHAQFLTMEKGALIQADALSAGDGGRVILWSDDKTDFAGKISATGGAFGGNGGFVETSGKDRLIATGDVDLRALAEPIGLGLTGTWLLDPTDITIYNRGYGGATDNSTSFLTSYLEAQSASSNIILSASHDINFDMTGDNLTLAGGRSIDLTAGHAITALSAGSLVTSSGGSITMTSAAGIDLGTIFNLTANGDVSLNGGAGTITTNSISVGNGNLTLVADDLNINNDLSGSGSITLHPYTANTQRIRLDWFSGEFSLDNTEIGHIADGWNHIYIGDNDNTIVLGTTTWRDPVTFLSDTVHFNTVDLRGVLTGLDNASFTFSGRFADINNNITTAGGDVTFTSMFTPYNTPIITTNGGNISFGDIRISASGSGFTANSGGGTISFTGPFTSVNGSTAGKTITINSGANTTSFSDVINGEYNLSVTGGTITFANDIGGTTPLGTVSINAINSLSLPSITADTIFARASSVTGDLTLGSGVVLTSGNNGTGITLVAGRNFINQSGSSALITNNGGRWLIYSHDPTGTTGEQLLSNNFTLYSCAYSGACPSLNSGNGLLFQIAEPVTPPPPPPPSPAPDISQPTLPPSVQTAQIILKSPFSVADNQTTFLTPQSVTSSRELDANGQTPWPWYKQSRRSLYDVNLLVTFTPDLKRKLGI